jgi:putative two-component system response regulator
VAGLAGDDADPASPEELEARRVLLSARGERFDGTGGPLGLAGDAIPPGARLLAVLDRFARLVRGRAYRPGLTPLEALAVLRNARGQTLDPRVVDAWCEVVEQDLARHNAAPSARPKEAA